MVRGRQKVQGPQRTKMSHNHGAKDRGQLMLTGETVKLVGSAPLIPHVVPECLSLPSCLASLGPSE